MHRPTIHLIDDDAQTSRYGSLRLEQEGDLVLETSTISQGLSERSTRLVDAVLVDFGEDHLRAQQALCRIQARCPGLLVPMWHQGDLEDLMERVSASMVPESANRTGLSRGTRGGQASDGRAMGTRTGNIGGNVRAGLMHHTNREGLPC